MNIYFGTYVISLATLVYEITLTRLLSVTSWYHLAFFAVSAALLGMTAGAVLMYIKPQWFSADVLNRRLSTAALGFSCIIPFSLVMLCLVPVALNLTIMSFVSLLAVTFFATLPFFCSGIVISAVITKARLPVGKLYASDMIGASCGCIFVLILIEIIDAPSLILCCSVLGVIAAALYSWKERSGKMTKALVTLFIAFAAIVAVNSLSFYLIRPFAVKSNIEDPGNYLLEKWNSFSRIIVYKETAGEPQYWGKSPQAPGKIIRKHDMTIDGAASTTLVPYSRQEDIEHLKYDVTNMVYYLRPEKDVCIIGAGAGRDVQSALLFNARSVLGIDINPFFIKLLKGTFRDYAGIAGQENVTLVADEARSYLTRSKSKFSVIQMSLIDTWASTGAGAFSLSENTLYTVEAWNTFLSKLNDDGIFTVSRWYNPGNPGETGRMISLSKAALFSRGVLDPSGHIAMITIDRIATLLLSIRPFTEEDILSIKTTCAGLGYVPAILPGTGPEHPVLKTIMAAGSRAELDRVTKNMDLNYTPPTDENPYFFNMLKLDNPRPLIQMKTGIVRGNILATLTLIGLIVSLIILTIVTIVVPLAIKKKQGIRSKGRDFSAGALYFSAIGAGFMFLEIALVQKLSILLSHPVYALGILLFSIIASAGAGSFVSERLPLTKKPFVYIYPVVIIICILAVRFLLPVITETIMNESILLKIIVSVAVIIPMGMMLGICFPTGMKLVSRNRNIDTPWYWALNGICGVLCSATAVFISIYSGINTNFYIAAGCYALLLVCLPIMAGKKGQAGNI